MSIEDRLRRHLQSELGGFGPAGPGPRSASQRARRRRRRAGAVAGVMALAGGGGLAGWAIVAGDEGPTDELATETVEVVDDRSDAEQPLTSASAAEGDASASALLASVVPSELTWTTVDEDQLGSRTTYLQSGDVLYALSTEPGTPGERPQEPVGWSLYSSSDGVRWNESVRYGDWVYADIDSAQGVLYSVGTAPGGGASDPSQVVIGVSPDGGQNWAEVALPPGPPAPPGLDGAVSFASPLVATDGDSVVVAAAYGYQFDPRGLLPAEYQDGGYSASVQEDGIRVIDNRAQRDAYRECEQLWLQHPTETEQDLADLEVLQVECAMRAEASGVVDVVDWSTLPYSLDDLEPEGRLYVSDDGTTFTELTWPFGANRIVTLEGSDAGYLAQGWEYSARSTTAFDIPQRHVETWTSSDGQSWERVTGAPWFSTVGSNGGAWHVVQQTGREVVVTRHESDGASTATSLAPLVDSIGVGDGDEFWLGAGSVSDGGFALLADVWRQPTVEDRTEVENGFGRYLFHSVDGRQWSVTEITDLIDQNGHVTTVRVLDDGRAALHYEIWGAGTVVSGTLVGS